MMELLIIALAALATILRVMFLILLSIVSGWGLAYLCIYSQKIESLLVPLVSVLESIPVIGFLPIVLIICVQGIGGCLGVELAVGFLVFVAVAGNIWMGIYQAFKTVPGNLLEVSENYDIGIIGKFRDLYIPYSYPRITANMFSSFVNAFFYVTVSEVFTVGLNTYHTFGVGTLISSFIMHGDLINLGFSLLFIGVAVVLITLWFHSLSETAVANYGADTQTPIKRHTSLDRLLMKGRLDRQHGAVNREPEPVQSISVLAIVPILAPNGIQASVIDGRAKREKGKGPFVSIVLKNAKYVASFLVFIILAYLALAAYHIITSVPAGKWGYFLSITPYLLYSMWVDYLRVGLITLASFVLAISVGYIMATNKRMSKMIAPLIQFVAAFPAPAYFPLIFIATIPLLKNTLPFFYVEVYIFVLGFLSCFYYLFFNFWMGVQAIPSECWDVMRNYNLGFFERMRYVVLPATFAYLITGLSSTINNAWAGIALGEYWPKIYNGQTLEAGTGMMKYLTQNIAQGHVDNAAWVSLIFVAVVIAYATLFTRKLMDEARKKYVIEEGIFHA
jgi:NitT/TauT family transport system permease protein